MKKVYLILITLSLFYFGVNAQVTGSFKDSRDGKVYKTVKIGTQWWMAENHAYKANSGCVAYDNNSSYVSKYGYFYNWHTAKEVCPSGWHLPSDAEWTQLTDYLGGKEIAGKKLKSKSGWNLFMGENYGNNESGFAALPGGRRVSYDGSFGYVGKYGYWWSSSQVGASFGKERSLHYSSTLIQGKGSKTHKSNGFSVRCLRDQLICLF